MKLLKRSLLPLFLVGLVTIGAGCSGSTETQPVRGTNQPVVVEDVVDEPATRYGVGDIAEAGEISHTVTSVEVLAEIPASYTLAEWEIISESLPADTGFQWVHIEGEVKNNSKQSQSVDSTNVYVVDATGNEFSVSTDTTIYVDSDKNPVYISMQPTQTIEWEGYFMVPEGADGLMLVGNDLSFLPEDEVRIELGI